MTDVRWVPTGRSVGSVLATVDELLEARRHPTAHVVLRGRGDSTHRAFKSAALRLPEGMAAYVFPAEGVVTLNSSVGIEGLLLERPVLCLGDACYAVRGVAARARRPGELQTWLRDRAAGTPDTAPLRRPFLDWLANEYVLPGSHRAPAPGHMSRLRAKLEAAVASAQRMPGDARIAA